MKKLIALFSFLAFFSLIFIGCQSTENISGPDDLSKPGPVVFNWGDPSASTKVDLVAGQTNEVGFVEVAKTAGGGLKVTYSLTVTGKIDEVHVDLTLDPTNFTVNSEKSPVFGNFDSKTFGATISGVGGSEVTVEFSYDQLLKALGVQSISAGTKIYIAAHSGVCVETGEFVAEAVCPDFPASATLDSWVNYSTSAPFQFGFTFSNPAFTADGWCVDLSKSLTGANGKTFNFVCSYDIVSNCIVRVPANLPKANWIINNRDGYDWPAVQMALWKLLSPYQAGDYLNPDLYPLYTDSGYEALLAAADAYQEENGPFKPGCDDNVLVLGYDGSDPCARGYQSIAYEVPVECVPEYKCDTAMGFNFSLDDTSAPFNHQWFRYFAFNY
jgi:hypothetical protein